MTTLSNPNDSNHGNDIPNISSQKLAEFADKLGASHTFVMFIKVKDNTVFHDWLTVEAQNINIDTYDAPQHTPMAPTWDSQLFNKLQKFCRERDVNPDAIDSLWNGYPKESYYHISDEWTRKQMEHFFKGQL